MATVPQRQNSYFPAEPDYNEKIEAMTDYATRFVKTVVDGLEAEVEMDPKALQYQFTKFKGILTNVLDMTTLTLQEAAEKANRSNSRKTRKTQKPRRSRSTRRH